MSVQSWKKAQACAEFAYPIGPIFHLMDDGFDVSGSPFKQILLYHVGCAEMPSALLLSLCQPMQSAIYKVATLPCNDSSTRFDSILNTIVSGSQETWSTEVRIHYASCDTLEILALPPPQS